MKNESKKVNFDLSTLSLKELITVYDDINNFLQHLEEQIIVEEEKEEE